MTLAQRTYLHTDGDDGADPLTNLLNPGPNVSILPHVPMLDAKVMAWTFRSDPSPAYLPTHRRRRRRGPADQPAQPRPQRQHPATRPDARREGDGLDFPIGP